VAEPVSLSVHELLDGFRRRELSPVEYLEAVFERIDDQQPRINALCGQYREDALVAARQSTERYAAGQPVGLLDGVPTIIKDETEVAGRRTTNGSLLWADYVSETSDPIVERLTDAGAIVHGRGLTPEFSVPFWTHSRMWGVTRNPWNTNFDVGGSSGGSAAAVAAGLTPWATGSDIGGSIRVPASCCGVVGYLPPFGRIPVAGVWGRDDWSRVGPLGRTVADCLLMLDVTSGRHVRDHFSLPHPGGLSEPLRADVTGLRVALSLDLGDWPVTDEVRDAVTRTAQTLETLGAVVTPVDLAIERDLVRRASNAHNRSLSAASLVEEIGDRGTEVNPYTLAWIAELDADRETTSFLEGRQLEAVASERVDRVLADHEVLLCPAMAMPAFPAGVDYTQEPFVLDGVERDTFHDLHLTEVFNIVSRLPVLCVPAGRGASGVPIGVQIVARGYDDITAFRVGAAVEAATPWALVAD